MLVIAEVACPFGGYYIVFAIQIGGGVNPDGIGSGMSLYLGKLTGKAHFIFQDGHVISQCIIDHTTSILRCNIPGSIMVAIAGQGGSFKMALPSLW